MLSTLFNLARMHFLRGSARESEYFAGQALQLSESLNAPLVQARAKAKQAEIHLYCGRQTEAGNLLKEAAQTLEEVSFLLIHGPYTG